MLRLKEKRFSGLRYARHRKSFDYKVDAKRRARELRDEGRSVRMVKEEGEWRIYSRRSIR